MFDKIKADLKKEASQVKNAINKAKSGVKGAKEEAKELIETQAKNLVVTPLIPFMPTMLLLLKKKNITFSASDIALRRYKIVEAFNKHYLQGTHFEYHFDMIEANRSNFEHAEEAVAVTSGDMGESVKAIGKIAGGSKGAEVGGSIGALAGTALTAAGVPPPVGTMAGKAAGSALGGIVSAIIKFFKDKKNKVAQDALKATEKETTEAITTGEVTPPTGSTSSFDFKKLLIPIVAVVAIFVIVKMKK